MYLDIIKKLKEQLNTSTVTALSTKKLPTKKKKLLKENEHSSMEFPIEEFKKGLLVELEHAETVDHNVFTVAKIVIDHLSEDKQYYDKLSKVEESKNN